MQNVTRIDLFYVNGDTDNNAKLNIHVGEFPSRNNFTQELIGDVTILMATASKMAGATTATATLND